ncbi:hypothetical protein [Nocardia pseudobrasiliensis]|uniref:hypothetical protein n=1 Tax=Nocardia pseudobrasiliensis TaxID=45979 RepID=UPI0020D26A67|nr:hypothetical protein [Nocardia pseudobrasiliensis]
MGNTAFLAKAPAHAIDGIWHRKTKATRDIERIEHQLATLPDLGNGHVPLPYRAGVPAGSTARLSRSASPDTDGSLGLRARATRLPVPRDVPVSRVLEVLSRRESRIDRQWADW